MDNNTGVSCTLTPSTGPNPPWQGAGGRGTRDTRWASIGELRRRVGLRTPTRCSPSWSGREHLEWMGTRCAWRGGVHPEREQDYSLGFELGEIKVGTAFFCGYHQLGGIPTCWIELIPCRAASSARRPALCRNRGSQAVGNATAGKWTRAAGEGGPHREEKVGRGVARPRWVGQPGLGAVWSRLDDDRHLEGPPRSRRLRPRDRHSPPKAQLRPLE